MVTLTVLTLLYFLPTVIAAQRGHGIGGIFILNFLFGWTAVGWFVLLAWALVSPSGLGATSRYRSITPTTGTLTTGSFIKGSRTPDGAGTRPLCA